jgi:hypothetical protein
MSFVGGLVVGLAAGLGLGLLLARRRARPATVADADGGVIARAPTRPGGSDRSRATIVVAVLALAASGVALARSDRHTRAPSPPPDTTTSTSPPASAGAGSTTTAKAAATVAVPNLVGQARATAETLLASAGLEARVTTLALSNVPAGFVITQNPQPATQVVAGATVSLVVSAAP